MFRGTTARTVVSILAAVLLALQFFAPTASFAHVHTVSQAKAKAHPGTKLSGKAMRDETLTSRLCAPSGQGDPTGPLRTRDRLRLADSGPQAPDRPLLTRDPASAHEPPIPGAAHQRTSRPSTSHAPAALQVFRC
ncbi:hypothetical protein J7F01_11665 [Streptomyces sp. ISL-22]|uniref:hypothetical protein n=1 Tax=unclassified Streptomyces TaxID=2593676 RepID=UPI001BE661D9|nr:MULTISPECIES: hypothetical protein [unclassified Streptomyces]MBT2421195.1 hypothetical protein [Streptomyces sp. ISL-24]MBT2432838.1 hypothetical protein [Streptomyces sp. ISL-22]